MRTNAFILIVAMLFVGCVGGEPKPLPPGESQAASPASTPAEGPAQAPTQPAPSPVAAEAPASNAAPAASPPGPPAPPATQAAGGPPSGAETPAPGTERVAAKAGVGKKGSGYGGGIITEPISAYFKTRDRMAFGVQIPHGMKMFHAMHNRYPKDMAEFKKEILDPAGIRELPELPQGHRYVFDPTKVDLANGETGLMVERPK